MSGPDTPRSRPRGVVLVGYRGTGKSTVGRQLAGRLGLPFVDADAAFTRRHGRSIASVFAESGEPKFRDMEEETLRHLTAGPPAVLATGGGAVLRPVNRERLKAFGTVVWLTARPEALAVRLSADPAALAGRPPLTSKAGGTIAEIAEVLEAREPIYQSLADVDVPTDGKTPHEVALAVMDALSRRNPAGGTPRC